MEILQGECEIVLRDFSDNYFDSCVTDPPYGLRFMGKKWDYDVPSVDIWREIYRVMKPGAHLLSFGGTRTYHRMVVNIEDAGFEIRDTLSWLFGSGFPKSLDVSKALDKAAGAEREIVGVYKTPAGRDYTLEKSCQGGYEKTPLSMGKDRGCERRIVTAPATPEAQRWAGWGTALKPAAELICLARKPLTGTVAENVMMWGTGALNVDGCRIETSDKGKREHGGKIYDGVADGYQRPNKSSYTHKTDWQMSKEGRFPSNVLLDEEAARLLDEQSGIRKAGASVSGLEPSTPVKNVYGEYGRHTFQSHGDIGGASRFFYCAKASRKERDIGLDSYHTVKYINSKQGGFLCSDVSMVAVQLLQKVISDSVQMSFNIGESGESIMALCRKDFLSIILMEINEIIKLKILDLLMLSLTSESTLGANSVTMNGGSLAENVAVLKKWILITTNGQTELALGASRVALEMLLKIKEEENWKVLNNFHSTVKPIALIKYLCKLITPPKGIILDPFAGSGTTGLAAEGFDFVLIEKEKDFHEIAVLRNRPGILFG